MKTLFVIIVVLAAILFILMWCNDTVCDYSICDILSHYCGLHKDKSIVEAKEVDLDEISRQYALNNTPWDDCVDEIQEAYKAGFELGLKVKKGK